MIIALILVVAISTGQLIKIPPGSYGGITVLDILTIILVTYGFKNVLHIKTAPFWLKTLFIFIGISTISLVFTPLNLSIYEYLISSWYILRIFIFTLLGLIVIKYRADRIDRYILSALIFSGIILAVIGIIQFLFYPDLSYLAQDGWDPHYFRTVSTFLDPNFLGAYLSLSLILIYQSGNLKDKNKLIFFLIVFVSLLTTFSRGAYLGFFSGFIILSALKKSLQLFLLTIALSLILYFGFSIYQSLVALPRNIDRSKSAEYRISTWQQGLKLFQDNPILGVGFNAYRFALREYNLGGNQFINSRGASANDSSLLHIAATTGIIGLVSYLLFLFSLLRIGWQNHIKNKPVGTSLLAGFSALFIQSFFSNTLFYPHLFIWLIILLAINSRDYDTNH